jgi:hypothetical protein
MAARGGDDPQQGRECEHRAAQLEERHIEPVAQEHQCGVPRDAEAHRPHRRESSARRRHDAEGDDRSTRRHHQHQERSEQPPRHRECREYAREQSAVQDRAGRGRNDAHPPAHRSPSQR